MAAPIISDARVSGSLAQAAAPSSGIEQRKELEAARQFEALLLQQWLKQARQSSGQTLLDSDQTRFAQSWSDEQLAQDLATPGIGLAQALLEQMHAQTARRLPANDHKR